MRPGGATPGERLEKRVRVSNPITSSMCLHRMGTHANEMILHRIIIIINDTYAVE